MWLKKIFKRQPSPRGQVDRARPGIAPPDPTIIPRAEHGVSRANISDRALKVLYRLRQAGYQSYLVGGGVRDLLLGREPKDFDIATDAHPEEVKALFRNCRLIGRRFRLAHVHFGREIIEVATFRAQHDGNHGDARHSKDGRILRDNVYGDLDDDVWRRDFTINALYYNIDDFSIVDYVGGFEDIQAGRLRFVGVPETRYREDPVRMLRAVRFAAKLGFTIDPATADPIPKMAPLLGEVPSARLYEEVLKLLQGGCALETYEQLRHYSLFGQLFPEVEEALGEEDEGYPRLLLMRALENTDARLAEGKPVNPAFIFAALLWELQQRQERQLLERGVLPQEASQSAAAEVIGQQTRTVSVPRRVTQMVREIWELQPRLLRPRPAQARRLLENPRFRAAYDFLLLRAEVQQDLRAMAEWWTGFQHADHDRQEAMLASFGGSGSGRKPRRRRRRRPRVRQASDAGE